MTDPIPSPRSPQPTAEQREEAAFDRIRANIEHEARSPQPDPLTAGGAWLWSWFRGHGFGGTAFLDAVLRIEREASVLSTPIPSPDTDLRDVLAKRAAVMEGWAAPPDLRPAGRWLSLSVALAILRGTHPALSSSESTETLDAAPEPRAAFAEALATAHWSHTKDCPKTLRGECTCHFYEDLAVVRRTLAAAYARLTDSREQTR